MAESQWEEFVTLHDIEMMKCLLKYSGCILIWME
jgi:hypothetical protein